MIDVKHLTKLYGRTRAVDDVSFSIPRGSVVGFLGPNAAGKSTTLKILTCFIPATSGSASIDGLDVFTQSAQVRQRIGYMPENVPLYPEMRVREYLLFRAALRGLPSKKRKAAIDRVAERCWLSQPQDMTKRRLDHLSRGYRQRVGLADCLLHDPPVLLLDEPTVGLDPAQVRQMRQLIAQLGETHTVVMSSHILTEVEAVCGNLIIIAGGKLVAHGTPAELRERVTGSRVVAELGGEYARIVADLKTLPGVSDVQSSSAGNWTRAVIVARDSEDLRPAVASMAASKGYPLRDLRREIGSLEDFFVQITYKQNIGAAGKSAEEAPAQGPLGEAGSVPP